MFISLCNFINHDCHAKYCLVQTLNGPFSRKARFYQIRSKLRIACASLSLCVIFFPFPTSLTEMSRISKIHVINNRQQNLEQSFYYKFSSFVWGFSSDHATQHENMAGAAAWLFAVISS